MSVVRPVAAGLAPRQPADQRGDHPAAKKDYWNSQTPDERLAVRQVLQGARADGGRERLYDALDTPATTNRSDLVGDPADRARHPELGDRARRPPLHPYGLDPGRHAPRQHGHQAERRRGLRLRRRRRRHARAGSASSTATCAASRTAVVSSTTSPTSRSAPSLEGYGPTLNAVLGVPNRTPNNLIGDGVDSNADMPFLSVFPYIGLPHQGYAHFHEHGATEF